MDEERMNHYEKQLYTVFKTFDVDNEEALDRAAVLQLCDALQLEARGAALVDSLFERRAERVTFATFRNGLLSVLGAAPAEPERAPAEPAPAHSDDDSSGREVAPKFVVGAKKYGRRSRPVRGCDERPAPRAASASRADSEASPRPRMRYKRSASAMEGRAGDERLDHDRRIDCAQAAALCRELHMEGIDPRLVERLFEDAPDDHITVGEFFDRLNAALTSLAAAPERADDDDDDEALPSEAVAAACERAGVRRARRLLAELGFAAAALRPRELESALDAELRALPPPPDEIVDPRPLLQLAALAVSRLRLNRTRARAAAAAAERDKLRVDLAEANRRAQLLAQDVDENHARLEAERAAALRQSEARHAEAARAAADECAAERERTAAARAELEAEAARRVELETRLRAELTALGVRAERLERRASAAEERAAGAERERARAERAAAEAGAAAEAAAASARADAEARAARLERLASDNARLRDRADELQAALEARAPRPAGSPPPRAADTSWRDEAALDADAPLAPDRIECESPPARREAAAQTEGAGEWRARLDELARKHDAETSGLNDVIAGLEAGLEALRVEYERCEEYWAGKLAEERAGAEAEAAAADARLGELLRRVADCERAMTLPALPESALEPQYTQLAQEFDEYKAEASRELATAHALVASLERELAAARAQAAPAPAPAPACACACRQNVSGPRAASDGAPRRDAPLGVFSNGPDSSAAGARRSASAGSRAHADVPEQVPACACAALWAGRLRARAAHAERAAARLLARLLAADALVADLYRENCQLQRPCARLL